MSKEMFEYTKMILKKVSFDVHLFCKEVKKAMNNLLPHEIEELKIYIQSLIEKNPKLDQCMIYLN
ncbi:hypothetical protein GCM10009117_10270 [Gangjinia marincola]|uniref:Uncharacterized protein n=1 Tax=Gangjinia marincola TaxID=578463 RepID=A0ABP3XV43_9FLAO